MCDASYNAEMISWNGDEYPTPEFLTAVLNAIPAEVMVIDRDRHIVMANRQLQQHHRDKIVLDEPCFQILHGRTSPCEGPGMLCPLQAVFDQKRAMTVEHRHGSGDGSVNECEISAAPILDAQGDVRYIVEVIRDIGYQKKLEKQQYQMEKKMLHIQKLESLGVLAGGIAHDFNNLLMGVLGFSDVALRDLPQNAKARSSILQVQQAAQRAAELSRQMLTYAGKGHFITVPLPVSELVQGTWDLLQNSMNDSIKLQFELDKALPAIEADSMQIRQALLNLVTNAVEAIGEKPGHITISTGVAYYTQSLLENAYTPESLPDGDYVYIEVKDDGQGIERSICSRIFDPFFTTKFVGRGLGLAAVWGIVRAHKGTVEVVSTPGEGTVVRMLFPKAVVSDEQKPDTPVVLEEWTSTGMALLIDDEATVRSYSKNLLKRIGFSVMEASSGVQGIELFEKYHRDIAIVLLDMSMPVMNGEQVFQKLIQIEPEVRVLLASGYSQHDLESHFRGSGIAGFIQKPYHLEELKEKVCAVFREKALK